MSDDGCIALGHRRLAILDLSPLGHQPMESVSGRYVLVFNGEIYDHLEIRADLDSAGAAPAWRGHSDTETLLAAIDAWGIKRALQRATGMFALALWDRRNGTLALARDRFGEKPLYYGWAAGMFAFASELGAIRALPGFNNPVDREALSALLSRTYIPSPLSIHSGLYKLPPATILTLRPAVAVLPRSAPFPVGAHGDALLDPYWSYGDVVRDGLADPFRDQGEAVDAVEAALAGAVARQSVADVPVGAFLSGGLDSSTVVALYQAASRGTIRTFSIGFNEAGFDEAVYARQVASHFGTQHHEMYVSSDDALAVIPKLATMYGEPFADSSAIPTHLVSAFARQHVTVALSGDGGDELFGGYTWHVNAPRLWRSVGRVPHPVRRMVAGAAARLPGSVWNRLGKMAGSGPLRSPFFGGKVQKTLRTVAHARSIGDVHASVLDHWRHLATPVLDMDGRQRRALAPKLDGAPDSVQVMYADALSYLPDDILAKVDRASMAVGLETRVPFLDHHVAATAARVPLAYRAASGSKQVLRDVLYRRAPRAMFERPKAGFSVPVGEWLRGPLRAWAEDLLQPSAMAQDGYLDPAPIQQRWQAHLAGRVDDTPSLWAVLMFQAWMRQGSAR